jgi:hypothetical protein
MAEQVDVLLLQETLLAAGDRNHSLLSQVLCNMAGLVGPNDVRAAVQKMVEKKEGSWDDGDWSVFVEDVVSFLLHNRENHRDVVAAAVGLIMYRATTQEKLQRVADNKEEFKRQLTVDKYGVPAAICDLLFAKYVAPAQALHTGARKRSLEEAAVTYDDCVRGAVWTTMGDLTAGVPASLT